MSRKVMVGNVPMSVIYAGMSAARFNKLLALYDRAGDKVFDKYHKAGKDVLDDYGQWCVDVDAEFDKLCARESKKSEWNNKPSNRVKRIIRTNKQKASVK